MSQTIKTISAEIAHEIADMKMLDINNVSKMIEMRIKMALYSIVSEYSTKEEQDYIDLLNEQSRHYVGSKRYNEIAYKITQTKFKKKLANRMLNNMMQDHKYGMFKDYIINRYGREVFDDFINETMPHEAPIYIHNNK